MHGWIKIHRDITNHWLYKEERKFSKFEAWNDILLTVNFNKGKCFIKGKLIEVERGQSVLSLDSWAKRWGWNKSAVKRFLNLLEKDKMIDIKNETVTTRLTVCNYDIYQDEKSKSETQTKRRRNANETQAKPIEEEKEEEKDINKSKINFDLLIEYFNKTLGKQTRVINDKAKKQIKDRLKEGYTKNDFAKVILNASKDNYHIETNYKYLTYEFLSRPDKFDRFLNQEDYKIKKKLSL